MHTHSRIQIVNYRMHGDDESYVRYAVYAAGERSSLLDEIDREIAEDAGVTAVEVRAAVDRYDEKSGLLWYVNDDITIVEGWNTDSNGRTFNVAIDLDSEKGARK